MIRSVIAFSLLSLTSLSYALTAEATPPSGTYEKVIRFTIRTDEPTARIVYTFEPDGTPDDALTYSGATWVGRDSHIMFFAYTDEQNATKILEREYRFRYPPLTLDGEDSVSHDASDVEFVLVNTLQKDVDLDSWRIHTSEDQTLYLAGTLSPWEKRAVFTRFSGKTLTVDLISPDEKVKDSRVFTRQRPPAKSLVAPPAPAEKGAEVVIPESTPEPEVIPEITLPAEENSVNTGASSQGDSAPIEPSLPTPAAQIVEPEKTPEIQLQSSALESSSSNIPLFSLGALVLLAAGALVWKKYQ